MGQWWRHCCARREGCRVPGGVSNGGSVPGGVSGDGIAALAVWGGTKKETQAPLSQRHACASHHREILKLNRNAFLCIGQTFFAHPYNLFYNYN